MLSSRHVFFGLIVLLCLFPILCAGEAEPEAVWDETRYVNHLSGIDFTLPENWVMDPDGLLLNNPFFEVLASDQMGANAIAIGFIDLPELVRLIPSDALGPYAGLLDSIDWVNVDGETIVNMMAAAFASGAFDEDNRVRSEAVYVGESEYRMTSIDLYEGALLQSILIRPVGRRISVILFSSSDQTGTEWFLSHFS